MDTGDTAWILASAALVLLMTPGLAFFYGGMTRAKSVLNMMMMSFAALAIVPILWVLYGYSFAFSPGGNGLLGGFQRLGFDNIGITTAYGTIPEFVFAAFQLMFAILTVALISGAIADRAKFSSWLVFIVVWTTIVYFPVAHWVFDFGTSSDGEGGGWIATKLEAIDFAGGTAVHINAGAAGLALALVLGRRVGWKRDPMRPHNLPLVLLGAGLLWFGWIGFNGGSALGANGLAGLALLNTGVATGAAIAGWLLYEFIKEGKGTSLGAASGAVAGLVAITPAAAAVSPLGSIVLGLIAGGLCAWAVSWKWKLGFDDSLDVVGVHLAGGLVGTILIGLLASSNPGGVSVDGLFYGGNAELLGKQTIAASVVLAYSFILTFVIGKLIDRTIGFRIDPEDEVTGIDQVEHLESAYDNAGRSRQLSPVGGTGGSPFKTGV